MTSPNTLEETVIVQKTRDLCHAILKQPEYEEMRRKIDTFMADEEAKNQYQTVSELGSLLQQKQAQGQPLSQQEIEKFEGMRDGLLNNSVARDFLDAQQSMHEIQETVGKFVAKTFELGRVPDLQELQSDCCGDSGCGCH